MRSVNERDNATFEIEVQDEHVEKVSQTRSPILALSVLIWNALDADAESVDVTIEHDELGGTRPVEVSDHGHSMPPDQAEAPFGKLGGSWKRAQRYANEASP